MIDGAVLQRSILVSALLAGSAFAQPGPAPSSAPASAPASQPIDVLGELSTIGQRALPKPSSGRAAATAPVVCGAPPSAQKAEIKKRVLAWIDQQFPDEKQAPTSDIDGMELVFNACKGSSAMFVDVSQDRTPRKKGGTYPTRRNFVLRIDGDKLESIVARTSTTSTYWMEWADEGRLAVIAEVDLDGDGAADLVWSDHEHEGGAVSTWDNLSVRRATGKTAPIARVKNLADVRVVQGQLVIAGQDRTDERAIYECVGKDLRVAPCAASASLQCAADKPGIAAQLASLTEDPDRDLAVEWLGTLGVKGRAALLAALPATTPRQKAERHVTSFLVSKQLDDAFQTLFEQPHPEAITYFDQLASQLGDTPCTVTPLTDEARARLNTWIGKQDSNPELIELTAECGTYAWAEWNHHGDPDRNEILVGLDGPEPVRVAKFKPEPMDGPIRPSGHIYDGSFFQHGDVTVGFVIRGKNLSVIANDKVVAQSHGEIGRYGYERRWTERSPDLLVDSGTIMHPTPTSLEKVDRDLVKAHEAYRAALERVLDNPPSSAPAYLAALRTLGADSKLVAECKVLAP
jgi:hypothetical protein